MQQNMTGVFSLPCSQPANVAAYLRVKIDNSLGLALAGVADREIGVLANTFVAVGLGSSKYATVCGTNAGQAKYTASGAITKYAPCFAGANGKVAATGTLFIGYTLDTATADGDVIRVARDFAYSTGGLAPYANVSASQTSGASNATLLAARTNIIGTSAAHGYVKLPAPLANMEVTVVNATGQTITLYGNGADTINGTAGATGISLTTGLTIRLYSDGTNWYGQAAS